jgi:hypothetical protein
VFKIGSSPLAPTPNIDKSFTCHAKVGIAFAAVLAKG